MKMPSEFDEECGTYGTGDFTEDSGVCAGPFICNQGEPTDAVKKFGECLYAMDCLMNDHMRTFLNEASPSATFVHQMVPHHANAVNMAKARRGVLGHLPRHRCCSTAWRVTCDSLFITRRRS